MHLCKHRDPKRNSLQRDGSIDPSRFIGRIEEEEKEKKKKERGWIVKETNEKRRRRVVDALKVVEP